jgi:hypothetical protein
MKVLKSQLYNMIFGNESRHIFGIYRGNYVAVKYAVDKNNREYNYEEKGLLQDDIRYGACRGDGVLYLQWYDSEITIAKKTVIDAIRILPLPISEEIIDHFPLQTLLPARK